MRPELATDRRGLAAALAREVGFALAGVVLTSLVFWPVVTGQRTFFSNPDNSIQSFAWLTKSMSAWRHLEPPLWDFGVQGGTSFVGELQTGVFYPLTIVLAWLCGSPSLYTLELFVLLHFVMAFAFMVYFLRSDVRPEAAVVGALVFAFVGTVARRANSQTNIFMGMVYLPLVLGLFVRGLRSRRPVLANTWLYASGAALALTLLAGHLQPYIHTAVALFVLAAFASLGSRRHPWHSAMGAVIFVGLVSIGLTAIQWLPTVEYLQRAYRWIGAAEPIRGLARPPFDVYTQLEVLQPAQLWGFLTPAVDIRDGPMLFVTLTGLGLALIGCFSRSRLARAALTIGVFSVLLALGGHTFVGRASWYVPVISYVREPVRALFLYQFGAAVLAALGTQLVIDRLPRRQTAAAGFTLLMATGILAEAVGARDWVILSMDSPFAPARYYADDALVRFLKERVARDSRLYRIADPSRVLPPNIGNVYALHSTGGHRATMSAGYFDFMSRDWSLRSEGHRLIGARYLVSPNRLSGFPEIFQSERGYVFERTDVLPVFQVVTASGERKAAQVSSVVWSENSVSFALDNAVAGELVFAQPAYPGWRVTLDGQTRMPVTSDAFMSVPLTGDERRVTWAYTPGFRWVGCATAALVVAGALWSLRAPRPRRDARRLEVGGH